mgnify:CR=1 FL=1
MDTMGCLNIDTESIIKSAIDGTDLPFKKVGDYTKKQLVTLVLLLIEMIQSLLLGKLGLPDDAREKLDALVFSAKKDSTNSSMRPSSDFGRRSNDSLNDGESTKQPDDNPSDEDSNGESNPDGSNKATGTGDKPAEGANSKKASKDSAATDAPDPNNLTESESEKALRGDHNRSLRTSSGRPVGKQPGEKGYGFTIPQNINREEKTIVQPERCKDCKQWPTCLGKAKKPVHNIYDVEISIVKKSIVTPEVVCPEDSESQKADVPEDAKGVNQYGINIRTMVALLYTVGMVSLNRIHDILSPMFGIQLSETTMLSYIHLLATKVEPAVKEIFEKLKKAVVVHCDETSCQIDKALQWIHCIATEALTFVSVQKSRGTNALIGMAFLTVYVGVVVHDCWSCYWCIDNAQLVHAICNCHIERELVGVSKFFKDASLWADDMLQLLRDMYRRKQELVALGAKSICQSELQEFYDRFAALIKKGKEIHPETLSIPGKKGKPKKGRARNLLERMELRRDELFRFLTDFDVPFSNNIAEQSFRLLATKKNVGIFRTLDNAEDFCAIWSYLSTARKQKLSYVQAIRAAFEGRAVEFLFPSKQQDQAHSHDELQDVPKAA